MRVARVPFAPLAFFGLDLAFASGARLGAFLLAVANFTLPFATLPLDPSSGSWAGWMLDRATPIGSSFEYRAAGWDSRIHCSPPLTPSVVVVQEIEAPAAGGGGAGDSAANPMDARARRQMTSAVTTFVAVVGGELGVLSELDRGGGGGRGRGVRHCGKMVLVMAVAWCSPQFKPTRAHPSL